MSQTTQYRTTETLDDDRAFNEEGYAGTQYIEADTMIRKMICIKLDVLAKDIVNFFKNSEFFDTDDPIITTFILDETNEGQLYWDHINITNEQGELFELNSNEAMFLDELSNELDEIVDQRLLDSIQKEQGFLFKVNKNSVYHDVQSTMNKIINTVEPSYVINKEKHMLQKQTITPQQSKQKPHL